MDNQFFILPLGLKASFRQLYLGTGSFRYSLNARYFKGASDMSEKNGLFPVDDGDLFFESAGDGEAVVFLHGFGLDSRMWEPQFKVLQSTFRVVRYDFRGFGHSSLPSHARYAHEDDLNALLSHRGAAPAHVVGLSMGVRMALRFAAMYPQSVRSLVLADSALDGQTWSADWQTRWNGMCHAARAGQLAEAKRLWLEHPLRFSTRRSILSRTAGPHGCGL